MVEEKAGQGCQRCQDIQEIKTLLTALVNSPKMGPSLLTPSFYKNIEKLVEDSHERELSEVQGELNELRGKLNLLKNSH
jgi:hypothetical protein